VAVEAAEPLTDNGNNEPARLDPIRFRLRVEAPGSPTSVRFLHTLQAGDSGAKAEPTTIVRGTSGTPYEGVAMNDTVVLFPVDVGGTFTSLAYSAAASTKAHLVTGLAPNASFTVKTAPSPDGITVTVTPNGDKKADAGGVLVIGQLP
jgi:hypothetical protein